MVKNLYIITTKDLNAIRIAIEDPSKDKAICLLQDAVYLAYEGELISKAVNTGIDVYIIKKDAEVRGIKEKIIPSIKVINYEELVDLVFNADRTLNL